MMLAEEKQIFQLMPRLKIIPRWTDSKADQEKVKRIPPTLLVGMQAGAATLENSMEVPQKVENRATL